MKYKTPVTLLMMVVLLTAFIWFFERKPPLDLNAGLKLFPLQRASIARIEITRPRLKNSLVLEKIAGRWTLTHPVKDKADSGAVERMLSEIEFARIEESIPKKFQSPLAEYALDAPHMGIIIADAVGKWISVDVGTTTAVGSRVYVKRPGNDDVFLLNLSLLKTLDRPAEIMRSRALLDFSPEEIARLEIRTLNQPFHLEKKNGRWQLLHPFNARADLLRVNQLLGELSGRAIEEFIAVPPADPKSLGFDEAATELTVTKPQDNSSQTLVLGSPIAEHPEFSYAKRKNEDFIFTVKTETAKHLAVRVNDVRQRLLMDFDPREVGAFEVSRDTESVRLAREDNVWMLKAPKETVADASVMQIFLNVLQGLQVREFVEHPVTDISAYNLDRPSIQIALYRAPIAKTTTTPKMEGTLTNGAATKEPEPELLVKLLAGRVDAEKHLLYVKRSDEPFVYGVDAGFLEKIRSSPLQFLDRTILALNPAHFQKLQIQHEDRKFVVEKGVDKNWTLATGILDLDLLNKTLESLATLRAQEIASDRLENPADYGLDKPEMRVTFEVKPPSKPGTPPAENTPRKIELSIGKESPRRQRYALVTGQSVIFEMDNQTFNRLRSLAGK